MATMQAHNAETKAAENHEMTEADATTRDSNSEGTESISMPAAEDTDKNPTSMELNVAYEALEQVRRANVALEFGGQAIDDKQCIPCLREQSVKRRWRAKRAIPCLTCGTPVCYSHSCPDLSRESITICTDCSKFFSFDFLVTVSDESYDERKQLMNSMLDVYDRALLILQYSMQYIDQIASALQHNTKRNNRIGVGSSATGLVSGITGVAAAAVIWTPVGPPLLVASILFGGGATAASAGSEAVNYRSEPNKMADRIIVLHSMVYSISSLVVANEDETTALSSQATIQKENNGSTRNWTRATMQALKPLTAGALSAASVVMEARLMKSTVQKIRAGSPCEKAETLKTIEREMSKLPNTNFVAKECRKYFMMDDAELNR